MGDVVNSRRKKADELQYQLKGLVNYVNEEYKPTLLSPYTITLGDEFQGITKSLHSGIDTIFRYEEKCLAENANFKLHYVLHYGTISTDINPNIAYEMMGPGLTHARELLSDKSRGRKRFTFDLEDEVTSAQFMRVFEALDGIIQRWSRKDYSLIWSMIRNENNAEVGAEFGKNRDQIWKRRKTLMIKEYNQLKDFIFTYIEQV